MVYFRARSNPDFKKISDGWRKDFAPCPNNYKNYNFYERVEYEVNIDLMTSRPLCYEPALKGFFYFSSVWWPFNTSVYFSFRSLNNLDSSSSEVRFRFLVSGATRNIHKDQIDLLPHFLCYFYLWNHYQRFQKHLLPFPLLTFQSLDLYIENTEWKDSNNPEAASTQKDEKKLDSNELLF